MAAAPFADIDAARVGARVIEDCRIDQPVMHQDIGIFEPAQRTHGEQLGIARPGADDADAPDASGPLPALTERNDAFLLRFAGGHCRSFAVRMEWAVRSPEERPLQG